MSGTQRNITEWRQGHVLVDETVAALGLVSHHDLDKTVAVVISHDCDIACSDEREPEVELIVGHRIDKLGGDTHAKNARRLHLTYQFDGTDVPIELEVIAKARVAKPKLLESKPRADVTLRPEELVTLQHWLAARYQRSAFADEFERRLKEKPSRADRKIASAMDAASQHVLAVLFDVDGGADLDRQGPEDFYELRITLLYDSTSDEPLAYEAAKKAADAIEQAFEQSFCNDDGAWRNIRLLSCEPVSDNAMTVAESRLLKRWRLDHVSLDDDHQQVMLSSA